MTEYCVHRLSVGDWTPTPVRSLAADPFSSYLAVGREDGSIEICNSSAKWYTVVRIPGREDFRLQTLVWATQKAHAGRLFGISLHGIIFEVDFLNLTWKNLRHTTGGAAWSLAASATEAILAVGCDDGMVRLFNYDDGGLEFYKLYPTVNARILSIAYNPSSSRLYVGCSDGTIRAFDTSNGRSLLRMKGDRNLRSKTCHILCLKALSDDTVISGDSNGNIQIWDGNVGVLTMSIHEHSAEILCLAAGSSEKEIFASGVDSKVTLIQKSNFSSGSQPWVYATAHRPHSHDVYSLAIVKPMTDKANGNDEDRDLMNESNSLREPKLVSAGLDGKLCLYSVPRFATTRPIWMLPIASRGLVQSSSDSSILVTKGNKSLNLWILGDLEIAVDDMAEDTSANLKVNRSIDGRCYLASTIELKNSNHIHSFSIAPSGKYLIASGVFGTRLWALNVLTDSKGMKDINISRIDLPEEMNNFASVITFSADRPMLAACMTNGTIILLDLLDSRATVRHIFEYRDHSIETNAVKNITNSITEAVFSFDGNYLAVVHKSSCVYVYDIDVMRVHWRLPRMALPITALAFQPNEKNVLAILIASNEIKFFNINNLAIQSWPADKHDQSMAKGKKGSAASSSSLRVPYSVRNIKQSLQGISFDGTNVNKLFIYGQHAAIHVDVSLPVPKEPKMLTVESFFNKTKPYESRPMEPTVNKKDKKDKKRKLEEIQEVTEENNNYSTVTIFRSIAHFNCLSDRRLVVVENPWVNVLERLPSTLYRKRYGT